MWMLSRPFQTTFLFEPVSPFLYLYLIRILTYHMSLCWRFFGPLVILSLDFYIIFLVRKSFRSYCYMTCIVWIILSDRMFKKIEWNSKEEAMVMKKEARTRGTAERLHYEVEKR